MPLVELWLPEAGPSTEAREMGAGEGSVAEVALVVALEMVLSGALSFGAMAAVPITPLTALPATPLLSSTLPRLWSYVQRSWPNSCWS